MTGIVGAAQSSSFVCLPDPVTIERDQGAGKRAALDLEEPPDFSARKAIDHCLVDGLPVIVEGMGRQSVAAKDQRHEDSGEQVGDRALHIRRIE